MNKNKTDLTKEKLHSFYNSFYNKNKSSPNKKKHTKAYRLLKLKRKYKKLKEKSSQHISELITALENVYQELSQTTDNPPKLYVSL